MGAVFMIAGSAWAGNTPEFDAVGCDNQNVFASNNNVQFQGSIFNNGDPGTGPVNLWSDFRGLWTPDYLNGPSVYMEYFDQTAGQLFRDPCFGEFGLFSALTDAWNEAIYEWSIVLQMKPESDINVNIYDCVLKHNEFDPYGGAEQTGRYRASWGQLMFVPSANPIMSVTAYPGEYATPGFETPFTLDARTLPGLQTCAMKDKLYTSKALWEEGIVCVLPETGSNNSLGETVYNLKHGDRIKVKVQVPYNNTADIRYGEDSVILKYIGIVGTYYYGPRFCRTINGVEEEPAT
jgi:hypothetical protein